MNNEVFNKTIKNTLNHYILGSNYWTKPTKKNIKSLNRLQFQVEQIEKILTGFDCEEGAIFRGGQSKNDARICIHRSQITPENLNDSLNSPG